MFAYVVNASDHPVRIYTPGFIGPNFAPGEKGREAVSLETAARRRGDKSDFVVLGSGEALARRQNGDVSALHFSASAYYIFYAPGREGDHRSITGILYNSGKWMMKQNDR